MVLNFIQNQKSRAGDASVSYTGSILSFTAQSIKWNVYVADKMRLQSKFLMLKWLFNFVFFTRLKRKLLHDKYV